MRNPAPNGDDVRAAATSSHDVLRRLSDADWHASVPDLGWTVSDTVAHIVGGLLWYAVDLSARGVDLTNLTIASDANAPSDQQLDALVAAARLLTAVVDCTPPDALGFHPLGAADPSGFAAMGCDEVLVHTWDATRGLGLSFEPDAALAARVLHRLFPSVEDDGEPWAALLWANGRTEWRDRPRRSGWTWQCAPLADPDP